LAAGGKRGNQWAREVTLEQTPTPPGRKKSVKRGQKGGLMNAEKKALEIVDVVTSREEKRRKNR